MIYLYITLVMLKTLKHILIIFISICAFVLSINAQSFIFPPPGSYNEEEEQEDDSSYIYEEEDKAKTYPIPGNSFHSESRSREHIYDIDPSGRLDDTIPSPDEVFGREEEIVVEEKKPVEPVKKPLPPPVPTLEKKPPVISQKPPPPKKVVRKKPRTHSLSSLNRVLSRTYDEKKYNSAIKQLRVFHQNYHNANSIRARALFYVAMSHYYLRRYDLSKKSLSHSLVTRYYRERAELWNKRIVERTD